MTLHEPATLLTDYLLAGLGGWLAWRLRRQDSAPNPARLWLARALALTAISAFIGGSYHGLALNLPPPVAKAWWVLTLFTIHLLSAAMALSWMHELVPVRWHRAGCVVIALKLIGCATASAIRPIFLGAIGDYGSTMLAWLIAAVVAGRVWRGPMLAAIALSGLAASVQQLHLAPAPWFNHNDLYHVIQAIGLFAFFRAGLRFGAGPDRSHKR